MDSLTVDKQHAVWSKLKFVTVRTCNRGGVGDLFFETIEEAPELVQCVAEGSYLACLRPVVNHPSQSVVSDLAKHGDNLAGLAVHHGICKRLEHSQCTVGTGILRRLLSG